MIRTARVAVATLTVPFALVVGALPAGAAPTKVADPDTVFHRLYVEGCANDEAERESFASEVDDLDGELADHQAEGSTSQQLERPTAADLQAAIDALKAAAQPGQEVTLAFSGHGGGGPDYGVPNGGDEPFDEHFRLNCGPGVTSGGTAGESLTDDQLAGMLAGFHPDVTIVVIVDACFGGGFTGGTGDIVEGPNVTVIGPDTTCPSETTTYGDTHTNIWAPFIDTLFEDVATGADGDADADDDGVVTADELKAWLLEAGWPLGAPSDEVGTGQPKGEGGCVDPGKGPCQTPKLVLPTPDLVPGASVLVDLTDFPAGEAVALTLRSLDGDAVPLGTVETDGAGAASEAVTLDVPAGLWLLEGRTETGFEARTSLGLRGPSGTFGDDDGIVHEGFVEIAAEVGITSGCGVGEFCPSNPLRRGQMGALLVRALDLPPSDVDAFDDDEGSIFEPELNALAAAGLTAGCGPRRFCPDGETTRGQMATFLAGAFGLDAGGAGDPFTDDDGSVHEANIEALAAAGITAGCTPDGTSFCPAAVVSRAQMTTFLGRGLFLPPVTPAALTADLDGDGDEETVRGDPTLAPGAPIVTDLDGDGDRDEVTCGTSGGGRVRLIVDLDGDGEPEVVVEDGTLLPSQNGVLVNLDPGGAADDKDLDVIYVGTKGGGSVVGSGDLDGDGDDEIVVEDPSLTTPQSETVDLDGDGDPDVVRVGTGGGGHVTGIDDVDGDGDDEVTVSDPTLAPGATDTAGIDGPADTDPDVIWQGPPVQ